MKQTTVRLRDQQGRMVDVPQADAGQLLDLGFSPTDPKQKVTLAEGGGEVSLGDLVSIRNQYGITPRLETTERTFRRTGEERFGGAAGTAAALAYGGAQALTAGLAGKALIESGAVEPETLAQLEATRPKTMFAGELAGTIPVAMATGGLGAGRGVAGIVAREAALGAAYGAGSEVTQAAIEGREARPLEAGALGGTIGGVLGGAIGGAGMAVERRAAAREAAAAAKAAEEAATRQGQASVIEQAQNLSARMEQTATEYNAFLGSLEDLGVTSPKGIRKKYEQVSKTADALSSALSKATAEAATLEESILPIRESIAQHRTSIAKAAETAAKEYEAKLAERLTLKATEDAERAAGRSTKGLVAKIAKVDADISAHEAAKRSLENQARTLAETAGMVEANAAGNKAAVSEATKVIDDMTRVVGQDARAAAEAGRANAGKARINAEFEDAALREAGLTPTADSVVNGALLAAKDVDATNWRPWLQKVLNIEAGSGRAASVFGQILGNDSIMTKLPIEAAATMVRIVDRALEEGSTVGFLKRTTAIGGNRPEFLRIAKNADRVRKLVLAAEGEAARGAELGGAAAAGAARGTTAEQLLGVFQDLGAGMRQAGYERNIAQLRAGEQVGFAEAGAARIAKADPNYAGYVDKNGAFVVTGVRNPKTGEIVGTGFPKSAKAILSAATKDADALIAAARQSNPAIASEAIREFTNIIPKTEAAVAASPITDVAHKEAVEQAVTAAQLSGAVATTEEAVQSLAAREVKLTKEAAKLTKAAATEGAKGDAARARLAKLQAELDGITKTRKASEETVRTARAVADEMRNAGAAKAAATASERATIADLNQQLQNVRAASQLADAAAKVRTLTDKQKAAVSLRDLLAAKEQEAKTLRDGILAIEREGGRFRTTQGRLVAPGEERLVDQQLKAFYKTEEGAKIQAALKGSGVKSGDSATMGAILGSALVDHMLGGGLVGTMIGGFIGAKLGGRGAGKVVAQVMNQLKTTQAVDKMIAGFERVAPPVARASTLSSTYNFPVEEAHAFVEDLKREKAAIDTTWRNIQAMPDLNQRAVGEAKKRFDDVVSYLDQKRPPAGILTGANATEFARAVAVIKNPELIQRFIRDGALRPSDVEVLRRVSPAAYESLDAAVRLLHADRPDMAIAPLFGLKKSKKKATGYTMSVYTSQQFIGAAPSREQPMQPGSEAAAARGRPSSKSSLVENAKLT